MWVLSFRFFLLVEIDLFIGCWCFFQATVKGLLVWRKSIAVVILADLAVNFYARKRKQCWWLVGKTATGPPAGSWHGQLCCPVVWGCALVLVNPVLTQREVAETRTLRTVLMQMLALGCWADAFWNSCDSSWTVSGVSWEHRYLQNRDCVHVAGRSFEATVLTKKSKNNWVSLSRGNGKIQEYSASCVL